MATYHRGFTVSALPKAPNGHYAILRDPLKWWNRSTLSVGPYRSALEVLFAMRTHPTDYVEVETLRAK